MPRATRRKYRKKSRTRRVKKKKRVVKRKRRRAKSKKSIAKSKRRVKLINKTIKRVQTKLADDVVVMRRMKPLAQRLPVNGGTDLGLTELDVRTPNAILDGQLALNRYIGLPVKYSDWWNINAFHGFIKPRYFSDTFDPADQYDEKWEPKKPWVGYSELFDQDYIAQEGASIGIDILAYDQREIPFLPCVPRHIDKLNANNPTHSRLNDFARKGDRIKVRSNYMRFNFYVQPGLHDMKPVFLGNGPQGITNTDQQYSQYGGVIKEFTLAARSVAKARIIVVKRNSDDSAPINLNDFLKDNNPFSMGDEMYRMGKYFNRKYKTDNDIIVNTSGINTINTESPNPLPGKIDYDVTKLKDVSNATQRGLHKVQIMYDKVHNLRVGGETVVKLSMMKGTVLKYEEQSPHQQEMYTAPTGNFGTISNNETTASELFPTSQNNDTLPVSTNELLRELNISPSERLKGAHNEYVPTGAKYAAFLLLMNQKCSTEYQIFQKFEFDN